MTYPPRQDEPIADMLDRLETEDPDLAATVVDADECRISRILGLKPCPEDHALTLIRACPTCKAAR